MIITPIQNWIQAVNTDTAESDVNNLNITYLLYLAVVLLSKE